MRMMLLETMDADGLFFAGIFLHLLTASTLRLSVFSWKAQEQERERREGENPMAAVLPLCASSAPAESRIQSSPTPRRCPPGGFFRQCGSAARRRSPGRRDDHPPSSRRPLVLAKPTESEEPIPSWARADSEEPPPWARNDGAAPRQPTELPFYVYLLSSAITAIAAVLSLSLSLASHFPLSLSSLSLSKVDGRMAMADRVDLRVREPEPGLRVAQVGQRLLRSPPRILRLHRDTPLCKSPPTPAAASETPSPSSSSS